MKKINNKTIVTIALLAALHVILSRFFSINAWNLKIGFAFLPVFIAAYLYGPLVAGAVGAIGDFVGALMVPIGQYFPGLTFSCFLTGIVFGMLLYKKQSTLRILAAVTADQLIISLLINSYWISLISGAPYVPLLAARGVQCLIMAPVMFITMTAGVRILKRVKKTAYC